MKPKNSHPKPNHGRSVQKVKQIGGKRDVDCEKAKCQHCISQKRGASTKTTIAKETAWNDPENNWLFPFFVFILEENTLDRCRGRHNTGIWKNTWNDPEKTQLHIDRAIRVKTTFDMINGWLSHYNPGPMCGWEKCDVSWFSRWWQLKDFAMFTPNLGGFLIQFDEHIFGMGWIHQVPLDRTPRPWKMKVLGPHYMGEITL